MSFSLSINYDAHMLSVNGNVSEMCEVFCDVVNGVVRIIPKAIGSSTEVERIVQTQPLQLPSILTPIPEVEYIGVTTYIKNFLKDDSSTSHLFNLTPIHTTSVIPDVDSVMMTGMNVIQSLHIYNDTHKHMCALNGLAVEAMLYQALSTNIDFDKSLDGFNSSALINFRQQYANNDAYNTIVNELVSTYNSITSQNIRPNDISRISFSDYEQLSTVIFPTPEKPKFELMSNNILQLTLYIATYQFVRNERLGFPSNSYQAEDIIQYCSEFLKHWNFLTGVIKYINNFAKNLSRAISPDNKFMFRLDVPIDSFSTKGYRLTGNADIIAIQNDDDWMTSGYSQLPGAHLIDIKCVKNDARYAMSDWPEQLGLYWNGLKNKYDIFKMHIVNIYNNSITTYDIPRELNVKELP